jgi:putative phosphoesterase
MKILVLADIHANWTAFAAIQEAFDACLFVGDLVDYGTDPLPCIDWVRRHSTAAVRGNHDHAVAQHVPVRGGNGLRTLSAATRPIHWDLLGSAHTRYLARLPVTKHVTVGDHRFFLVHGTPRDPLDEYLTADAEGWTACLSEVDADFVCVGHTHVPFHLKLDRLQVLNPGSVGQPRDGDPRCSYAVIEDGNVEIRRVAYDIDATVRQMRQAGLGGPALELAETMLRTGGSLPDATNATNSGERPA